MSDQVKFTDATLETAGSHLVSVSVRMAEGNRSVPAAELESLTGIGGEVTRFLNGLNTARLALADGAKTASGEIAGVMRDSSDLDARMAADLYSGFAVMGKKS